VDPVGSGQGPVAGSRKYGDELSASGATELADKRREDGGSELLRNVGQYPPAYTAQRPRRRPSHTHYRENMKSHQAVEDTVHRVRCNCVIT
jgi:hypothetical protein